MPTTTDEKFDLIKFTQIWHTYDSKYIVLPGYEHFAQGRIRAGESYDVV